MTGNNHILLHADIILARRFGAVERTVFRLVLNGYDDVREIRDLLRLFSLPVIANAVRHLVNSQILTVDTTSESLSLSQPLVALLYALKAPFEADIPENLRAHLEDDGALLVGGGSDEERAFKLALVRNLVPGINLDRYAKCFDFVLIESKRGE